ncbi:MAG: glycerophosphodiester phosphodiesterase [Gemmatimonadota bacterium]|jgi:glycerophosphoryl diester phosphodiesterase
MIIIGHRGAAGLAPEHTFASWDLALEAGADYLEQDLQLTADGVLIVMHDDSLDRTARGSGCRGPVRERAWAEIRECDVGSWFNEAHPERARPEYTAQRIPSLDAVLERYAGRGRFYIETKNPDAAPGMEAALVRLLGAHDLLPREPGDGRVIIQSFSERSLLRVRDLEPRLPLVLLLGRHEIGWTIRRKLRRIAGWATGIGPGMGDVDRKLLAAAHALGLVVHPWTVNDPADLERLASLGVDGVFTDFPDRAAALRRRRS